jgi:hypothetical protein
MIALSILQYKATDFISILNSIAMESHLLHNSAVSRQLHYSLPSLAKGQE